MSSQSKKRPQNKGSTLLTDQENDALFRLLSDRNGQKYTLASGVVQLLAAEPSRRREWQKKFVGVVCFIKDYAEKGYFLRLYDITKNPANALLWEQSFYDGFYVDQKAHLNAPELVTFEGDDCVYGLNFSSASEANEFTRQVNRRYEQEQKSKSRSSIGQPSNPPISSSTTSQNIVAPSPILNFGNGSSGGKSAKKKKGKLTKNDISLPTNFEHRVHVGWDPGQGFRTEASSREDLDPQIKMLLDKIGMPTNIGKKDIKMVYDIIDQHGGMEALKNELSQPPPPPSRSPPQVPTAPYSGHSRNDNRPAQPKARDLPPPPPIMTNNSRPLPQPPSIPMQPPPGRPGPPAPPNPPAMGNKNVSAPHPPPPPPPPPPLAGAHVAAPPPPPPPPPPVASGGGGSNLLAEIAQGVSLKPVHSNEGMHTSRSSDSRDAMLSDIKGGINLRPVDRQERQRITPPEEMGGIAGALARALQDRRFQITDDTDSDDDNDDDEEDEWDD